MIAVSAAFTAAEVADIAQLAYQVFLVRGNYASTAAFGATITSSGDDASGDYPATGIGDGDRTEINMGATDAADNGVGLSSWKSSTSPTAMAPVWVQIDFGQDRTWNYIKLYNYSGDPLTSYALQWSDNGSSWTTFAGTADQGSGTGYTGATGGLDVYDFTAYTGGTTFTHRYLRCLVYTTTSTGPAQIVELEVYYRVDVTARVTALTVDRQRDWKQVQPMAATCSMTLDNSDRYFSPSYTPTAAETTAGYFNGELDEGLGVVVKLGYWYSAAPYYALGYGEGGFGGGPYGGSAGAVAGPEIVTSFVGTIDSLSVSSRSGMATLQARDGMKDVLNQTWSTRLKTNIDNGAAIQYMLNICNISDYETSVATTGIIQPYFFVYEQSAFTVIQELVQACGNAAFWFDENGIATFEDYLINAANSHTDFAWPAQDMGDYTTYGTGTAAQNGNTVTCTGTDTAPNRTDFAITYAATQTQGWQFTASSFIGAIGFMCTQTPTAWAAPGAGGTDFPQGYIMSFSSGTITFYRCDSPGTVTSKLAFAYNGLTLTTWTILRLVNGGTYTFYIYANGVLKGSFSDNTYTTSSYFNVMAPGPGTGGGVGNVVIASILLMNGTHTATISGSTVTVTSASIDQSADLTAEGTLSVGFAPSNAPITFETRTSPDDSTWAAWTAVTLDSTQQGDIQSAAQRHLEYRYSFTVGSAPFWNVYYIIASWAVTASSATVRSIDGSTACDLTQSIAGDLGGDSSIINYFEVLSAPIILTGDDSTQQWQATTGFPGYAVSADNPMNVAVGTTNIQAAVSGGMDVTQMTGTNPTVVAITWGTALGSVTISFIHPTKPIITLTVTTAGTITDLRLVGRGFSNSQTPIVQTASDAASQDAHKRRPQQISNNYITVAAIAQLIANSQLALYENATEVLDGLEVPLAPSAQLTDQLQVTDTNLGLTSALTWKASGLKHEVVASSGGGGTARTVFTALAA
jgi:hypothetical protein